MSDFNAKIQDALSALIFSAADQAKEKTWLQIDNPDNEREENNPGTRQESRGRPSTHGRGKAYSDASSRTPDQHEPHSQKAVSNAELTNKTHRNGRAEPQKILNTALNASPVSSAQGHRKQEALRPRRSHVSESAGRPSEEVPLTATNKPPQKARPNSLSTEGKIGVTSLPSGRNAPAAQSNAVAETRSGHLARSDVLLPHSGHSDRAIRKAGIVLNNAGPVAAAQTVRELFATQPATEIGQLVETAWPLLAAIVDQLMLPGAGKDVNERSTLARTTMGLTHLSAALETAGSSPSTRRLVQDISSRVLAAQNPNDNAIFGGLAHAVAGGACTSIVLSILSDFEEDKKFSERKAIFLQLIEQVFLRVGERAQNAYKQALHGTGPLLIEWASWQEQPAETVARNLLEYLSDNYEILVSSEPDLDRLERAGLEAVRTLNVLRSTGIGRTFSDLKNRLAENESIAGCVCASRSALLEIGKLAENTNTGGVVLDAVKVVVTDLGFQADRASFIADLTQIGGGNILGRSWTKLENFSVVEQHGKRFQKLLALLNGQYRVIHNPVILSFDDLEL